MIDLAKNPELNPILINGHRSIRVYTQLFLAENFDIEYSIQHKKIAKLTDRRLKRCVVCATRGIGKTTFARAIAAQAICYCDARFIVYVGESATLAELQTENLKKDLLMSTEIRETFGDIRAISDSTLDDSFSKKSWVATVGTHQTLVLPRGSGQQVRGLIWKTLGGNFRPDLIIVDDLEEKKTIDNPDQRSKRKEWFFGDLMKCIDRRNKNWRVFYIDTLKHEDSLIQDLMDAPEWEDLRAPICDENYVSFAPDFMTNEEIEEEVRIHQDKDLMDVFAQEIMCMPISKKDATFKSSYFKYYEESDKEWLDKDLPGLINVVIVDPAKTTKQHSAESGFVVWGFNPVTEKMFLRYAAGEKLHPDHIYDRAIDLAVQYNAVAIGIEETGLNEFVIYPLQNELIRRGLVHIVIVPLQARTGKGEFVGHLGGKKARIASMVHFYRRGLVYHLKGKGIGAYELQLLGFPKSKRWDIMDAAAYISEIMSKGEQYFWMPHKSEKGEEALMEEQEKKLDKMDRLSKGQGELNDDELMLVEEMEEDWRDAP